MWCPTGVGLKWLCGGGSRTGMFEAYVGIKRMLQEACKGGTQPSCQDPAWPGVAPQGCRDGHKQGVVVQAIVSSHCFGTVGAI